MTNTFGEAVTNTVAIAANYWRIHTCGKPMKGQALHNCLNTTSFHQNRCRMCSAQVTTAQEKDHVDQHSHLFKFLAGRFKPNQTSFNEITKDESELIFGQKKDLSWVFGHQTQFLSMVGDAYALETGSYPKEAWRFKAKTRKKFLHRKLQK